MANEILRKYRPKITIATATAITSNTYQAFTSTNIDNSLGATNGNGADELWFELVVSAAPSTQAGVILFQEVSHDGGSTWTEKRPVASFPGVLTSATKYYTAVVRDVPKLSRYGVTAIGYGMTVALNCTPALSEVQ